MVEGFHMHHSGGSYRDACLHHPLTVLILHVEKNEVQNGVKRFAKPLGYLRRSFGSDYS